MMAAPARTGVFLSYRRQDTSQTARELFGVLRERLAVDFFMDVDSIAPGDSFPDALETALMSSRVVLVLIGPNWLIDRLFDPADFVHREVSTALARGIPVIPVLVQNARMPCASDLPRELTQLANRQAVELRCAERVRNLIHAIEQFVREQTIPVVEPRSSQLACEVARFQHDLQEAIETEELQRLEQTGLTPQLVIQKSQFGSVSAVAFRPDGRLLAYGTPDGAARLWDFHRGTLLSVCAGHTAGVGSVSFSPDGTLIATMANYPDNTLRIWDCPSGKQLDVLPFQSGANQIQFSSDWRMLLVVDHDLRV